MVMISVNKDQHSRLRNLKDGAYEPFHSVIERLLVSFGSPSSVAVTVEDKAGTEDPKKSSDASYE